MANKQRKATSGLVTPPIVSPRPIQTINEVDAPKDAAWKVVGSPPKRPMLSPPEEQARTKGSTVTTTTSTHNIPNAADNAVNNHQPLDNKHSYGLDLSSSTASIVATASSEPTYRENMTADNAGDPSGTSSGRALSATDFSPTPQQTQQQYHHQQHQNQHQYQYRNQQNPHQTPSTPSPSAPTFTSFESSPTRLDQLLGGERVPASEISNATLGIPSSRTGQDLSFGPLTIDTSSNNSNNNQSVETNSSFYASTSISNNPNRLLTDAGSGLVSPLSMPSFAWNGAMNNNDRVDPMTTLASNLGGMTTGIRQEGVAGTNHLFAMSSALEADPFVPTHYRSTRSLSLTEPPGFLSGFGNNKMFSSNSGTSNNSMFSSNNGTSNNNGNLNSGFGQEERDALGPFRAALPTMEEETEDVFDLRANRTRSYSTSAAFGSGPFFSGLSNSTNTYRDGQDSFAAPPSNTSQFAHRKMSVGSTWPSIARHNMDHGRPSIPSSSSMRRQSLTSVSSSFISPIWESPSTFLTNASAPVPPPTQHPLEREPERVARQPVLRRFSVAPSSGFQNYDRFLESENVGLSSSSSSLGMSGYDNRHPLGTDYAHSQRRHSVAGTSGSSFRPSRDPVFKLTSSLESMQLEEAEQANSWNMTAEYEHDEYHQPITMTSSTSSNDLGKGLTLSQLLHHGSLYVVEFKAGRSDLFYVADNSGLDLKRGDLVMVEADRGKDLGKITNDSIMPHQIQELQKRHAEAAALAAQQEGARAPKEIHPKRIFRPAHPSEIAQLVNKNQDEINAMKVCQTKVRQKKLPMEVVDAEYQWDRRKLTFYFQAEHRIDFRELVRDLFKIYKTRIWMYSVNPSMVSSLARENNEQSSTPRGLGSPSASPSSPQQHYSSAYHPPPEYSRHLHHLPQQQQQHNRQNSHHHQQHHHQHHHPHHAGQYQAHSQSHMQAMAREMDPQQYFSTPQQPSMCQTFQQPLEEEPLHTRFFEQFHPLQPPHPLS
ncbi:hypothetical protein BG011_001336 [Mortierella polycephala]|uniref:PSP1 C-terminal domain-containing protein n=1 Tax=Mortierella polycephala TaxID=41804 RepID=A0A9P6U626_9FUNG|nr:hypothetical protein BG011_001336 [Mortierella polycephala]